MQRTIVILSFDAPMFLRKQVGIHCTSSGCLHKPVSVMEFIRVRKKARRVIKEQRLAGLCPECSLNVGVT